MRSFMGEREGCAVSPRELHTAWRRPALACRHMESSNWTARNLEPSAAAPKAVLQIQGRLVTTIVGLAVAWWVVLLVPDASREFLLDGTALGMLWGFARVATLVSVASVLFRRMPRSSSWKTCVSALGCLWGGSAAFALTIMLPRDDARLFGDALSCVLSAPPLFMIFAWYAVFPMTILTAIVLSSLYARAPRQ
jgi:hypothetical protein